MFAGSGFAPIKSPPTTSQYLSIQSLALPATIWPEFQCQIMPRPQFVPPFWGYSGPRWLMMAPIEMSSPYSYATSIHTIRLSCTVWPQYTTRQTDRTIEIGRLCSSIGSLIMAICNGPASAKHIQEQREMSTFTKRKSLILLTCNSIFDSENRSRSKASMRKTMPSTAGK